MSPERLTTAAADPGTEPGRASGQTRPPRSPLAGRRTAGDEAENVLARAGAFFRIAALAEQVLTVASALAAGRDPDPAMWAIFSAIMLEGALLVAILLRDSRIRPAVAAADLLFVCTVLVADGAAGHGHPDRVYLTYSYSIISSLVFGIALHRLRVVMVATAMLMAAYIAQWELRHGFGAPNVTIDAATYVPNLVVAWAVAKRLRHTATELDDSRARVAELAKEQERTRHARILHDHVLQTIESLVQQDAIPDRQLARAVAADAAWLRSLVEGTWFADDRGDLISALQELVQRKRVAGLRVEFNARQLYQQRDACSALPGALVDAVTSAVGEALTNVTKHAGTDSAVLRATLTEDELTVSVLDRGIGFDRSAVTRGVGIRQSITARIEETGGKVRIDAAPGEGTYVEIVMPAKVLAGRADAPPRP